MGFPATGLGLQKLRKKVEEIGLMERSSDDGKSNLLTWQQRERCGAQAPGRSMIVPCPGGGEGGGGGALPLLCVASEALAWQTRSLARRGHSGSSGPQNGRGWLVKFVFKLVAMEICFKDS